MLKNPQIKYEGQVSKRYVFQKYPGKYFTQSQKHSSSNNNLSVSKSKQSLHQKPPCQQYKALKAQAEYIQKIHQIKKRLQTQIKRYKKNCDQTQETIKKYRIHAPDSKTLNLQQICLGLRRERYKSEQQNPEIRFHTPSHKVMNRKSTVKFLLKNKAWIRKNLKTQQQSFLIRHRESISQNIKKIQIKSPLQNRNIQYFKSIGAQNNYNIIRQNDQSPKKQFRFPSLQKMQSKMQNKSASNRAQIRYSLDIPRSEGPVLQKNQKNLFYLQAQGGDSQRLLQQNSNRSSQSKSKIKKIKILQLQGETKSIQKRQQNRRKYLLQRMQPNESDVFLKGWEGHNEKYQCYNDNIGVQQYQINK